MVDVLHLCFGGFGGHMAVTNALAKDLDTLGVTSGVIAVSPAESILVSREFWPAMSLIEPVVVTGRGDVASMARVFAIGRRTKARAVLVHTHRHAAPLAIGRLSSGQPVNMVSVEHHSLELRTNTDNANSISALLWSKASVFLTEEYLRAYPLRAAKLPGLATRAVIANGIDLKPYISLHRNSPRGIGGPTLGMAARLVPSKDVETILEAITIAIKSQDSKVPHLRIAGDGPERSRLEARVAELNIRQCVSFLGHVPESQMPSFLDSLDIYVLSTHGETFNTSLIQAAAARVPIVATRAPGIASVFTDGVDAILFEPADPSSLEAAIKKASDPSVASAIVAAAFELVSSKFNSWVMTEAYLSLLALIDPSGPWLAAKLRMGGEADPHVRHN